MDVEPAAATATAASAGHPDGRTSASACPTSGSSSPPRCGPPSRRPGRDRAPWWAPPEHLDTGRGQRPRHPRPSWPIAFGYLNTLFTQTIPFAGEEFGAGNSAQGVAGSLVRVGGVIALVVVAAADRRGRRKVMLGAAAAGCVLAVTGALAPSLAWLTASQMLARAFASALLILVGHRGRRGDAGRVPGLRRQPAGHGRRPGRRASASPPSTWPTSGPGAGGCSTSSPCWPCPPSPAPATACGRAGASSPPTPRSPIAGHGGRLAAPGRVGPAGQPVHRPPVPVQQPLPADRAGLQRRRASGCSRSSWARPRPSASSPAAGIADVRGRRIVAAVALVGGTACTVAFFFSGGWTPVGVGHGRQRRCRPPPSPPWASTGRSCSPPGCGARPTALIG